MGDGFDIKEKLKIAAEIILAVAIATVVIKGLVKSPLEKAERENAAAAEKVPDKDSKTDSREGNNKGELKEKPAERQSEETIAPGQYPIMGKSVVTVEEMVDYFEKNGGVYPSEELSKGGADNIEDFCKIYYDEAEAEGVRAEVAFVQTMKETGWLKYGGDAEVEQFNFAGLGVTGDGVKGNSFPDVRTGVRAQIQHLKAYASADGLNRKCVDERYDYVKKGSAPYVEWLGQQENPAGLGWATGENYGYSIVEMINDLKNIKFR